MPLFAWLAGCLASGADPALSLSFPSVAALRCDSEIRAVHFALNIFFFCQSTETSRGSCLCVVHPLLLFPQSPPSAPRPLLMTELCFPLVPSCPPFPFLSPPSSPSHVTSLFSRLSCVPAAFCPGCHHLGGSGCLCALLWLGVCPGGWRSWHLSPLPRAGCQPPAILPSCPLGPHWT